MVLWPCSIDERRTDKGISRLFPRLLRSKSLSWRRCLSLLLSVLSSVTSSFGERQRSRQSGWSYSACDRLCWARFSMIDWLQCRQKRISEYWQTVKGVLIEKLSFIPAFLILSQIMIEWSILENGLETYKRKHKATSWAKKSLHLCHSFRDRNRTAPWQNGRTQSYLVSDKSTSAIEGTNLYVVEKAMAIRRPQPDLNHYLQGLPGSTDSDAARYDSEMPWFFPELRDIAPSTTGFSDLFTPIFATRFSATQADRSFELSESVEDIMMAGLRISEPDMPINRTISSSAKKSCELKFAVVALWLLADHRGVTASVIAQENPVYDPQLFRFMSFFQSLTSEQMSVIEAVFNVSTIGPMESKVKGAFDRNETISGYTDVDQCICC